MTSFPSKDDVEKQMKDAIPELEELLSNLSGSRIRISKNDPFFPFMSNFTHYVDSWTNSIAEKMQESEKKKRLQKLLRSC